MPGKVPLLVLLRLLLSLLLWNTVPLASLVVAAAGLIMVVDHMAARGGAGGAAVAQCKQPWSEPHDTQHYSVLLLVIVYFYLVGTSC
jgi:hypothetical protein